MNLLFEDYNRTDANPATRRLLLLAQAEPSWQDTVGNNVASTVRPSSRSSETLLLALEVEVDDNGAGSLAPI